MAFPRREERYRRTALAFSGVVTDSDVERARRRSLLAPAIVILGIGGGTEMSEDPNCETKHGLESRCVGVARAQLLSMAD